MNNTFIISKRNFGHWDICDNKNRLFCIRGGPSNYVVRDERENRKENIKFKTVNACMSYICDLLMFELIIVEKQKSKVIENWNI